MKRIAILVLLALSCVQPTPTPDPPPGPVDAPVADPFFSRTFDCAVPGPMSMDSARLELETCMTTDVLLPADRQLPEFSACLRRAAELSNPEAVACAVRARAMLDFRALPTTNPDAGLAEQTALEAAWIRGNNLLYRN
jgi:hypothetical protein